MSIEDVAELVRSSVDRHGDGFAEISDEVMEDARSGGDRYFFDLRVGDHWHTVVISTDGEGDES